MNKCIHCKGPTSNPKYCSRSCAASANNRRSPRRVKSKVCNFDGCLELIFSSRKFCAEHRYGTPKFTTIGELRQAAQYQANAYARQLARKWARKNLDLSSCTVCDYSLHVEVAHISPLSQFPDHTPIEETYVNNLIVLCPNHHWEYDNGYLVVP